MCLSCFLSPLHFASSTIDADSSSLQPEIALFSARQTSAGSCARTCSVFSLYDCVLLLSEVCALSPPSFLPFASSMTDADNSGVHQKLAQFSHKKQAYDAVQGHFLSSVFMTVCLCSPS